MQMTSSGEHFILPNQRKKMNHLQFLSDFWNLNRQFKRNPYRMPKIRTILLKLEGFKYSRHWS